MLIYKDSYTKRDTRFFEKKDENFSILHFISTLKC